MSEATLGDFHEAKKRTRWTSACATPHIRHGGRL